MADKTTIYVVEGSTGEYSDSRGWVVAAFWKEEDAQQRVIDAERRANELKGADDYWDVLDYEGKNEFDPAMQIDYTGTHYFYFPVEVI